MESKMDIKYLVLWIANGCNLNCKYCYAAPKFNNEMMSFKTAKTAIERCKEKDFTLILAGGEPLLNFKIIEEIYDFLKMNGFKGKIGLQTNGTLINGEIAEKLAKMDINVGISLDGTLNTNQYLRGETKKVIQGITYLKEYGKNINLNCVVTNKNVDELEKLVEMAYYFGNVGGIGLDLLRITGNCLNNSNIFPPEDKNLYSSLKKAYKKIKLFSELTGKKIGIREIEEIRHRKSTGCGNDDYCYSSLGKAMVITPQGEVYPCSSLMSKEEYYMGNIFNEIKVKKLNSGKYKKCDSCEYKKVCKGGCPSRLICNSEYGLENKDCTLRKAVFKILEEER